MFFFRLKLFDDFLREHTQIFHKTNAVFVLHNSKHFKGHGTVSNEFLSVEYFLSVLITACVIPNVHRRVNTEPEPISHIKPILIEFLIYEAKR